MDLPVRFPSETEVILEDVARFRALSPSERIRAIVGLVRAADRIRRVSSQASWADRFDEEQERLAGTSIKEFLARHGY